MFIFYCSDNAYSFQVALKARVVDLRLVHCHWYYLLCVHNYIMYPVWQWSINLCLRICLCLCHCLSVIDIRNNSPTKLSVWTKSNSVPRAWTRRTQKNKVNFHILNVFCMWNSIDRYSLSTRVYVDKCRGFQQTTWLKMFHALPRIYDSNW